MLSTTPSSDFFSSTEKKQNKKKKKLKFLQTAPFPLCVPAKAKRDIQLNIQCSYAFGTA
jgi:hypothetical protein